ncbi:MAG: N-acetylmuramoyl-L-alanine amidase [Pseudomonadota bacterium]
MTIAIKNGMGFRNGSALPFKRSPNVGGKLAPEYIVLHDTASGLSSSSPINWLTDPASKVSAHVVIARDGTITQLVPFNVKAWHAGQSIWKGRPLLNGFSVGLEIVNPGRMTKVAEGVYRSAVTIDANKDPSLVVKYAKTPQHGEGYWLAYTDEQVRAVTELCRALCLTYPIEEVITHYLISPGRKVDVNPLFPLEQVRAAVAGSIGVKAVVKPVTMASVGEQDESDGAQETYQGKDYDAPIGTPDTDESDGGFGQFGKLIKSKIAWASTALGGVSLTTIAGFLTDWRTVTAFGVIGLAAYIIWLRSQKP